MLDWNFSQVFSHVFTWRLELWLFISWQLSCHQRGLQILVGIDVIYLIFTNNNFYHFSCHLSLYSTWFLLVAILLYLTNFSFLFFPLEIFLLFPVPISGYRNCSRNDYNDIIFKFFTIDTRYTLHMSISRANTIKSLGFHLAYSFFIFFTVPPSHYLPWC